jgi:hypothetical protein
LSLKYVALVHAKKSTCPHSFAATALAANRSQSTRAACHLHMIENNYGYY